MGMRGAGSAGPSMEGLAPGNHVAALAVSLALLISVTAIYTPFYSKKKKDEEGRSWGFWREVFKGECGRIFVWESSK